MSCLTFQIKIGLRYDFGALYSSNWVFQHTPFFISTAPPTAICKAIVSAKNKLKCGIDNKHKITIQAPVLSIILA